MARMKRFASLFALLFLSLLLPAAPRTAVRAETYSYAVAPDTNVWFYTAESESAKLFLLPETYYVHVLLRGEQYTAVEYLVNDAPYQKIMGYCRTDALLFVDFIPARPYLRKTVTVSYTLPDDGGGLGEGAFGSIERTFVYYGKRYENGQLYFYVLSDGVFDFIPAEAPVDFERNDDWLYLPDDPVGSIGGSATESDTGLRIAIICAVSAAGIAVAILVLRGRKTSPADSEQSDA